MIAPLLAAYAPIYTVKLVRLDTPVIALPASQERPRLNSPRTVVELLWQYFKDADREHIVALMLDTKGQLIGLTTISIGDLSSSVVHPREVFKAAILANAAAILLPLPKTQT